MSLGPHATFIWAAYGAMALGVVGLLAWLAADASRLKATLADLEARGVRRRAPRADNGPDHV
jgi:heme exporter protein D